MIIFDARKNHIIEPTQAIKTYILYCLLLLYSTIIGIAIIMKHCSALYCIALHSIWFSSNSIFFIVETGGRWCRTTIQLYSIAIVSLYKLNIYLLLHFCCFVYTEIGLRSCKGRLPKHIYGFLLSRLKQSQQ